LDELLITGPGGTMNKVCLFVLILLFAVNNYAATEKWVARYNGPANVVDGGMAVAVDGTGNVYVAGRSANTTSTFECTTIKYDSLGNEKWIKKYHGPASSGYSDTGWGIAIDKNGNVYVAASSRDSVTLDDIAVLKYDANGNELWVARYNGPGNDYDWPFDIAVDENCNVYVTGRSVGVGSGFDYITLKYDSLGNEKWAKRYNGPGNSGDEAYSIAVDAFGNVYITGTSTGSGTGLDFATIKYDSLGNEVWVARYNTSGEMDEFAATLAIDGKGNVYVTGGTWKFTQGIPSDYLTIRYNANGDTVWVRRYNGPGNDDDVPEEIATDPYGNVDVTGKSVGGAGSGVDFLTIQYDSLGNENWTQRYNGPGNGTDQPSAIAVDNFGNVYVTGKSRGTVDDDYASIVYDPQGNVVTVNRYDGPNSGGAWQDAPQDITSDSYGNFYVTGLSGGIGSAYDFATVKYSGIAGVQESENHKLKKIKLVCFPNPFTSKTIINWTLNTEHLLSEEKLVGISIYDMRGQLIRTIYSSFPIHSPSISWDGQDAEGREVSSGIYFLKVRGCQVYKIIKIK